MVFEAALRGVDLEKEAGTKTEKKYNPPGMFEFKSPEEYQNLSMEERVKLTQEMIGKHKLKFG